eukprot:1975408-Rhodomonas_salina.1
MRPSVGGRRSLAVICKSKSLLPPPLQTRFLDGTNLLRTSTEDFKTMLVVGLGANFSLADSRNQKHGGLQLVIPVLEG